MESLRDIYKHTGCLVMLLQVCPGVWARGFRQQLRPWLRKTPGHWLAGIKLAIQSYTSLTAGSTLWLHLLSRQPVLLPDMDPSSNKPL